MKKENEIISPRTKFGQEGRGITKNDTIRDAIPLIHDIFYCAIREELDVFIVCRHVDGVKDKLFHELVGVGFTSLLQLLLEQGRNVSILIWSKDEAVITTPEFEGLRSASRHAPGRLEMRISGSDDPRFGHFIIAVNHRKDRWIVRLEKPHGPIESSLDFPVPAAVIFNNEEAHEIWTTGTGAVRLLLW